MSVTTEYLQQSDRMWCPMHLVSGPRFNYSDNVMSVMSVMSDWLSGHLEAMLCGAHDLSDTLSSTLLFSCLNIKSRTRVITPVLQRSRLGLIVVN